MFDAQVAALRDEARCVTVDFRGQGRSAPARRGFQVEQQAADVVAVVRRLGLAPVHLVGLSMGGFVAMRLAARMPELVRSVALLNTSAAPHPQPKVPTLLALAGVARLAGVRGPLLPRVEAELYAAGFRTDPARAPEREAWRRRWAAADRSSLVRTLLGFLVRPDMRPELGDVTAPTLVVAGGADASLPPAFGREIHRLVPGSRYVELPGVGHSSPVEAPGEVTRVLTEFLAQVRGG
jgi:pimeloyl-ACP methyl ester carboxylesterase